MVTTPNPRRDGWTAERRAGFLNHLGNGASVRRAAALVGMARETAYRLRRRDAGFAREWAVAQRAAALSREDTLHAMLPDGLRAIMLRLEAREAGCDLRRSGFQSQDCVTP